MSPRTALRAELRWLLRLLSAPVVIDALFSADRSPWPTTLRGVLAALPSAEVYPGSRPKKKLGRDAADLRLQRSAFAVSGELPAQYLALVQHLIALSRGGHGASATALGLSADEVCEELRDLSRYVGLPELFDDGQRAPRRGIHENHCHFRGGVPFLRLWDQWRADRRLRGTILRAYRPFPSRPRSTTWAEYVDRALRRPRPNGLDGHASDRPADTMEGVRVDELVSWLAAEPQLTAGETLSVARYLAACIGLRVYLLHQRGSAGLDAFVKSYKRFSKVQRRHSLTRRKGSDESLVHAILDRMAEDGVSSVEIRPTLDSKRRDLSRKLRHIARGHRTWVEENGRRLAMAIVPSLLKTEGFGEHRPSTVPEQQRIWRRQTRTLLALIEDDPLIRHYVVGLDAAGSEQGIPPRLFAAAFELVHAYNHRHAVAGVHPGRVVSPDTLTPASLDDTTARVHPARLGLTMHAGEDFVDPITGLRHIWEALTALRLSRGDRLGHALAAGLDGGIEDRDSMLAEVLRRRADDPATKTVRAGRKWLRVAKPIGAEVLDLSWQMHVLPDLRAALSARLAAALAQGYAAPCRARDLGMSADPLGSDLRIPLPAVHYESADDVPLEERIWVELNTDWMNRFDALRSLVRREIRQRRVVVESCPTSNIAVANLPDHLAHAFHAAGIHVTVSTDDPGVFGVYPSAEFARLAKPTTPGLAVPARRLSPERAVELSYEASYMRFRV